ncbi:MAG: hypothetical protein V1660_00090 [archaeon]
MVYSHASRDLRNRHDIYSFIPAPQGYLISSRQYRGSADLSGYLRQAGWSPSSAPSYILTHDSYRLAERSGGGNPSMLYDRSFSKHKDVYAGAREYRPVSRYTPAGRLEQKLFLN